MSIKPASRSYTILIADAVYRSLRWFAQHGADNMLARKAARAACGSACESVSRFPLRLSSTRIAELCIAWSLTESPEGQASCVTQLVRAVPQPPPARFSIVALAAMLCRGQATTGEKAGTAYLYT